ncbi:MAG: UbiA family prenyltransferase, partial [Chitinispirillia bacterium]|nr:UbiA family prenyltransferase [Chitinispirillia bacterium]MCL2242373.1 UbiA family prenyltransferase [Chitinispirillia bacterium]
MTGIAVALGIWLTDGGVFLPLMLAAMAAAAYGNVINDIIDVKSDRVSHPNRPLANGTMSPRAAKAFAAALAAV